MHRKFLVFTLVFIFLLNLCVVSVYATTYIGLKRVTVGEMNGSYPETILVQELTSGFEVYLYNSTDLVCHATVNDEGVATLYLRAEYRSDTFEGTFKIYDTDNNHVFTEIFDDTRGGDEYEALVELKGFMFATGVVVLLLGVMVGLPTILLMGRK